MNSIKVSKLGFSYKDVQVFENFDINLSNSDSYSIIGPSSCGKSTLAKLLGGMLKNYSGKIEINGQNIANMSVKSMRKLIITAMDDDIYIRGTLKEEMMFSLENLGYNPRDILKTINYIVDYFDLQKIIDKPIKELTKEQKIMTKILSYVIIKPYIIVLDDLFKWVSESFKKNLMNFLSDQDVALINIVSNEEDVLYTDYLIVLMKNGNVAVEGKTIPVLKEEKLLKRLGFKLPFMVDLSIQLKCYELIDDIYLDEKELIDNIWK